jgi:CBS domain-containing protein
MMYTFLDYRVGAYMTADPIRVMPDLTLRDLQAAFERHDFNAFPVVDRDGRMVGLVTKLDFLKAFTFTPEQIVPHYDALMRRTVADVMTEAVIDVDVGLRLTRALELMVQRRARSFPVVDGDGQLVGMIAREDVMRALRDATRPDTIDV